MDRIVQAYSKSCLTRTLIGFGLLVVITVAIGGMVLFIALLPSDLVGNFGPFIFIFLLIGFVFLMIGGVAVWAISVTRRRAAQLDAAFIPLGLTASRYLMSGRQFEGSYRGRKINAYFYISGGRYLRTPVLQIYIGGDFKTRLGIGTENALTRAGGAVTRQEAIPLADPAYEGLLVYPLDETWSRSLLADRRVSQSVARLAGKDMSGTRGLAVAPESILLTIRHFPIEIINAAAVRAWIEDMVAIAETAEGQLPPTVTAEAGKMEQASQSNRAAMMPIALAIVAALILCPVIFVAAIFGVLVLTGGI